MLAGHVDPDGLLNFIPFLAAQAVGANYRVVTKSEEPSYRQLALARSYAAENSLAVYLREANVCTSRIYHWHKADPVFLLFTDDVTLARPLYGDVNLISGLAATAVGLALLPADSGGLLREGLNGVVYSLPELAFVSIRQGSFPIAPRGWLKDEGMAQESPRPATGQTADRSRRALTPRVVRRPSGPRAAQLQSD